MKEPPLAAAFAKMAQIPSVLPQVRMPRRDEDCPAAPICEAVGNLRKCCTAGGMLAGRNGEICTASLILLVGRALGMWPDEMIDEVEKQRIGFVPPESELSPESAPGASPAPPA